MASLVVVSLNCRGQTRLNVSKQLQIEDLIRLYQIDVLLCQEIKIEEDSFNECDFISSSYNIFSSKSQNEYGMAILIKNTLQVENINFGCGNRIISVDCCGVTICNIYPHSGTDGTSRQERENLISYSLTNILINRKHSGIIAGDWNCIVNEKDCTANAETKMSPSLRRVIPNMDLIDSYRKLWPKTQVFSHYYEIGGNWGGTRIDRAYHYGNIVPIEATYKSVAFSDHRCLVIKYRLPDSCKKSLGPKSRPFFKISPLVINDADFKMLLTEKMDHWKYIRNKYNYDILEWWENIVKPGMKKLAIEKQKDINKSRRGMLNLLYI